MNIDPMRVLKLLLWPVALGYGSASMNIDPMRVLKHGLGVNPYRYNATLQ